MSCLGQPKKRKNVLTTYLDSTCQDNYLLEAVISWKGTAASAAAGCFACVSCIKNPNVTDKNTDQLTL